MGERNRYWGDLWSLVKGRKRVPNPDDGILCGACGHPTKAHFTGKEGARSRHSGCLIFIDGNEDKMCSCKEPDVTELDGGGVFAPTQS